MVSTNTMMKKQQRRNRLLCDENGEYINFTEDEIVSALEEANDSDVRYFKPTDEEQSYFHRIYQELIEVKML